jgi:hypothetical protein
LEVDDLVALLFGDKRLVRMNLNEWITFMYAKNEFDKQTAKMFKRFGVKWNGWKRDQ